MENITSIRLMGGLGNQLFQIFTTIAYGIKNNRQIVFPYSESLKIGIERPTYWDNFLSSMKNMTTFNSEFGITNALLFVRFSFFNENGFTYTKIPSFNDKEVLLNGYFQSYKYFEEYNKIIFSLIQIETQKCMIKNEFSYLFSGNFTLFRIEDVQSATPTPLITARSAGVLNEERCTYVSMHFRLGDYVNIQDCHPLLTYSYYENAIRYIVENNIADNLCVIYFCQKEDNNIVSSIIDKLKLVYTDILFVKADDEIPDWKQMLVMSCCHHNIIANSTFSWWGAYFNSNKNKIICYPSVWFGSKISHDTCDLFPKDWIKIL